MHLIENVKVMWYLVHVCFLLSRLLWLKILAKISKLLSLIDVAFINSSILRQVILQIFSVKYKFR